ncbi:MAG: hypothetical protein ACMG6S_29185 [Byssovorax sp.]
MTKDKRSLPPLSTWLPLEGILVLVAAGVTAVAASLPIIFVPGVLAYAILAYLRYRRFGEAPVAAEPLRPDLSALCPEHAARVNRCASLQEQIVLEIRSADAEQRAMLAPSEDRVRGLLRSALLLAQKLQKLEAHLGAEDLKKADREAQTIERRIVEAHDPAARQSFERALLQHRQKALVIQELRAQRERGDAQLTHIELTLETVAARILRIKSAEAGAMTEGGAGIVASLDALSIEVEAAAEAVDEVAEADAPIRSTPLQ